MSCTLSIIAEHNNPQAGTLRGQLGNKVTTLATARIQASALIQGHVQKQI